LKGAHGSSTTQIGNEPIQDDLYNTRDNARFKPGTDRPQQNASPSRPVPGAANTDKSKKKIKLDEVKQDLYMSKESKDLKQDITKLKQEVLTKQEEANRKKKAIVYPVMQRRQARAESKKRVINEDLILVESAVKD
jgi:hypothetical protein